MYSFSSFSATETLSSSSLSYLPLSRWVTFSACLIPFIRCPPFSQLSRAESRIDVEYFMHVTGNRYVRAFDTFVGERYNGSLSLSLSLSFCQPFPPIGAKIDSWNRRNSRNETEIAEHVVLFSMDVLWFVVWNSIGDTEFYFWNARWTLL